MSIQIREIFTDRELVDFVKFQIELYRGNEYFVPPIISFEIATLSAKKNPAYDYCKARFFMAYKDGKAVGRVAAILHGQEAEDHKLMRFGWIDFIDDFEVSKALTQAVNEWAVSLGMLGIHGPMGFTDLDLEGTLIAGFDQPGTQVAIYNYPYYQAHFEALGMTKACDWIEGRGTVPKAIPVKLKRASDFVRSRFNLKTRRFKSTKTFVSNAPVVFDILNKSYSDLYGYYPLTEKQVQYYVDLYFGFLRTEFVTIVYNEKDEIIAFAICVPSMTRAFQKAKGKLFPFGFIHLLLDFYWTKKLDLLLIATHPDYQKQGASALVFTELLERFIEHNIETVTTGPMLEDNWGVLNLWNDFAGNRDTNEVRRRCFKLMY